MQRLKFALVIVAILAAATMVFAEEELFDTTTATLHLEKGISHLKAKSYNAAIIELEEAVSIYPNAENYYFLGYAYYMKGKAGDVESRKNSMENFERAYELNPQFAPSRLKFESNVNPTYAVESVSEQTSPSDSGVKQLEQSDPSVQNQ